jgi:hypothetical protein
MMIQVDAKRDHIINIDYPEKPEFIEIEPVPPEVNGK